jgi:hypothetical protein
LIETKNRSESTAQVMADFEGESLDLDQSITNEDMNKQKLQDENFEEPSNKSSVLAP